MKTLIKALKKEIKLRETQLDNPDLKTDYTEGMIYGLKTALIFAEEGGDGDSIVRMGK